jgi:hypothetical protein
MYTSSGLVAKMATGALAKTQVEASDQYRPRFDSLWLRATGQLIALNYCPSQPGPTGIPINAVASLAISILRCSSFLCGA